MIAGMPVHSIEEAKRCAASLLSKGFRKVILTLGARGSLIVGEGAGGPDSSVCGDAEGHDGRRGRFYRKLFRVSGGRLARKRSAVCARIFTPDSRRHASARRNHFRSALSLRPNGRVEAESRNSVRQGPRLRGRSNDGRAKEPKCSFWKVIRGQWCSA